MGEANHPHNAEHWEAEQQKTNLEREEFFAKQPRAIRNNLKAIERVSRELEKRNIPFLLFASPGGYKFEKDYTNMSPFGFWRYQKLYGNTEPYSEECVNNLKEAHRSLFSPLLSYLSFSIPECTVVVYGPNREIITWSTQGKIAPFKENE